MFWPDLAVPENTKVKAPRPQKAPPVFNPDAVGCNNCALKSTWSVITTPKMPISGNAATGDVLFLAEGPGETEDRVGEALVGKSGKLIRELIPGRHEHRIAFQNIVRCRPEGNRTPTMGEAHACSTYLDDDIADMPKLKAILGIGAVPLRRFFPGASIMRVHGLRFPVSVRGKVYWYYPIMHPAFVLRGERDDRYEAPAMPVFRADVRNFFRGIDNWGKPPRIVKFAPDDVILPKSEAEAQALIDQMRGPVGIDLETVKLRPYERGAVLATAAISDGRTAIAFPIDHPEAPSSWGLRVLIRTACTRTWIAHNAAMEYSWLTYYNKTGEPLAEFEDSMALVRLYHERESVTDLGLSSHIHLGTNVKSLLNINTENILAYPLETILRYNGLDAQAATLIYHRLADHVDPAGYERIVGSVESTTAMELAGLPVDVGAAYQLREKWTTRAEQIRRDAAKLHEVRQFEADRGIEFNIASTEHVGVALVAYGKVSLPRTSGGATGKSQYATDEQTLLEHGGDNPLARTVLDYREAVGMTKYIDPTLETVKRYPDGMLHPTYTTMLVATQRLSSRDPNIQNYPARKHPELRRQIIAPKGCVLAKFDYGQLEARVLAMASKDRVLRKSIIEKFDIHSYWLDKILDEFFPDYMDRLAQETGQTELKLIRKRGRDIIKSDLVFNALYGGGADSISKRTKIPLHVVEAILAHFWQTYRGVKDWHKGRRNEYRDTGAIRTLTGRVRRGLLNGNEPINTPIQGTGADIVIESMNEVARLAKKERDFHLHPRINIHDDLTFFLPEDPNTMAEYIDTIHPILTRVRFPFQIVPLTVELKIGDNWHQTEEIATFAGDYIH